MVVQCFMDQAVKAARALFAHVEILIQKNFQDDEDFFDAFGAKKNGRDLSIKYSEISPAVFIGEGDKLKGTKFINGTVYDSVCC